MTGMSIWSTENTTWTAAARPGSTAAARFASAVPMAVNAGMSAAATCDISGESAENSCMTRLIAWLISGMIRANAFCNTGMTAAPMFITVWPNCESTGQTAANAETRPDANDTIAGSICAAKYSANGVSTDMTVLTAPPTADATVSKMPGTASNAERTTPTTVEATSATVWKALNICDASTSGK